MASLLVDSPPAASSEQKPANGASGASPGTPGAAPEPPLAGRRCTNCGSPLAPGQDWCLQCGAGAPGSLSASSPRWRSSAAVLGATAVLVLGAAAAAYAALSKSTPKARTVTTTVAQATTPAPPAVTTPVTPKDLGTTAVKPTLPPGSTKPPKIPLTATVPKVKATIPAFTLKRKASIPPASVTTPAAPKTGGSTHSEESQPNAILLDTNAASTYNPYSYPASNFGDPSLAIDGDSTTAWTAQVDPTTAPRMAEGLLIDLKSAQRLSAIVLVSSTPGMTVQVYGANTATVPASITDPAWLPLSSAREATKKRVRIDLRDASKAFSFVTLWISKAPAASIGSAQTPGHVSVNELELLPAA